MYLLRLCGWGQQLPDGSEGFTGLVRDGEIIEAYASDVCDRERLYSPGAIRAVLTRDFSDASVLKDARDLLKEIIEFYALGGRMLSSRRTVTRWRQFSR